MGFGKIAKQETVVEKKGGNPPIHTERAGLVKADVWSNKSHEGKDFFTVSVQRSYKEKDSEKWENTTSFRINDLPRLILVLQKVYERQVLSAQDDE